MKKVFALTRGQLIDFVAGLDEKIVDVQLKGLNNTIHWHIGHVLVVAESFLFGFPKQSQNIPANYHELFGYGSKPSDWTGDIPSVETLLSQLKEQQARINEIPEHCFGAKLPFAFPIGQLETLGEVYELMVMHEGTHLGEMKVMKKIIEA